MKKALKIIFVSLACLFLVVVVAGYIALTQIDFNNYKKMIIGVVKDATGRELKIGDIKVKPSFSPVVEINEVAFSNANWAKNPEMVSAKNIELSVALLPLLHKNFQINSFKIKDGEVNLEENAQNGAIWVFEKEVKVIKDEKTSFKFEMIKSANASENKEKKSDSLLSNLVIKEVALNNVKINYTDKSNKTQMYSIKNFDLSENLQDNIDFDFDVNNGEYKGNGVIGALKLLEAKKGYPIVAKFNVMGIDVSLDVKLFDALGEISFDGKAKALKFLGKNSSFNESVEIGFKGNLKNIDVVIRELKVAENVVEGNINCNLSDKVPFVKALLSSPKIDIASFGKKEKTVFNIGFVKSANATELAPEVQIPYNVFGLVNVDSNIKIAKLVNNGGVLGSDIEVGIGLNNGKAVIDLKKGVISKGNLGGKIGLNAKNQMLDVDVSATKIDMVNLMKVLKANTEAFNFLDGGLTDVYLKFNSHGNTYADLVENLDGNSVIVVDKSKLYLGNIGMLKGNIVSQLLNTLSLTKGNNELNMSCAVVRADFKDKKAYFPNGIVVNADKFTIVANGDINLENDALSISVKPFAGKLTETNIAKALSSLVKLTGTISNPKIGVDSANAIKTIVGVTTAGPVYLGAQMLLESDGSPCYSALVGTGYEKRFPEPKNVVSTTSEDVGKILDDSVGTVKDTTKGLINLLSGSFKAKSDKK